MAGLRKPFKQNPWLGLGIRYILYQWSHYWLRTGLSILGTALGVAVVLAIQLTNHTTLERFRQNVSLIAGQTDATIVSSSESSFDESLLNTLTPLWHVDGKFAPVVQGRAVILPKHCRSAFSKKVMSAKAKSPNDALAGVPLDILGVDFVTDYAFRPIQFVSGPLTPQAIFEKNTVYIPQKLAQKLKQYNNLGEFPQLFR